MTRVFVFEYVTGGGAASLDATACAELLPAGLAMRDAVVADLLALPGVQVGVAVEDAAPRLPTGAVPLHAQPGEALPDFVARMAASHDVAWVIAPESDGLLERLATRTGAVAGASRWLGCDAAAIAVAAHKRLCLRLLDAHGIATPLQVAPPSAPAWVVKPADGAGCVATRRHATLASARADLDARQAAGASATLEPWVDGVPISASLHCGVDAQGAPRIELLAVNRQRIVADADGWLHDRGVAVAALPRDDDTARRIETLAQRVGAALPGLRGFVGIDLVLPPDGEPVLIELNPRTTCAYVGLSAALGRNIAGLLLADRLACHRRAGHRLAGPTSPQEAAHAG